MKQQSMTLLSFCGDFSLVRNPGAFSLKHLEYGHKSQRTSKKGNALGFNMCIVNPERCSVGGVSSWTLPRPRWFVCTVGCGFVGYEL